MRWRGSRRGERRSATAAEVSCATVKERRPGPAPGFFIIHGRKETMFTRDAKRVHLPIGTDDVRFVL